MTVKERIQALRKAMQVAGIDAWIVPGTDPHMSEYLPDYWAERAFISGFTGSAGKVVVTQDMAGLWTDGRYFIQAEKELKEGGLQLFKEKVEGTPTIEAFLKQHLPSRSKVGINGLLLAQNQYLSMMTELAQVGIELICNNDLIASVWNERPVISAAPLFLLPEEITGESTASKLSRLRASMGENDAVLLNALDEIAWLYNLRGSDVECNPVVVSYAWIEKEFAVLFVDENKVDEKTELQLAKDGISLLPYEVIFEGLNELSAKQKVQVDFRTINHLLLTAMSEAELINTPSWIATAKAQKNAIELEGTRRAMLKDGVALTQFFMWLEKTVARQQVSEYEVGRQLDAFRARQKDYVGESFAPIVGYQSNGAIVHYSAPQDACKLLDGTGLLLLDSGGQYRHGTTDITRTVALGAPSAEMKKDFTLVLKGHINLAQAKFPKGTRGNQLDSLARIALWKQGKDYQHGTGHGVGHFLNVHEGPQGIRKEENKTPLADGMILSNEPGFYKAGAYGIRIENLVTVRKAGNDFFEFETLTLCPIDSQLVDVDILTDEELEWFNSYHQEVYRQLESYLDVEEKRWLEQKTLPILR